MVVIFFTVNKGNMTFDSRQFADYLKSKVLANIDQKKVKDIDLSNTMKQLVTDNLDTLFKTNDDLMRDEVEIEGFLKVLEKQILELSPKQELHVTMKAGTLNINEAISEFSWDESKYPKNNKTISEIMNKINEKYSETRKTIKAKSDDYSNSQNEIKMKQKGKSEALTLMKQDYRDLVSRSKSEMKTSDYLCTMLCFVPTGSEKYFLENYFKIADGFVVPYSALRIDRGEDEKVALYRVVVMKNVKDDFKNQCQGQLRVACREYDEEELSKKPAEEREIEILANQIKDKKANLIRIAISGFSEVYYALLHLKYLRLYVESCLKYTTGDYYSVVVFTPKEREQKLVSAMIKTFNDTKEQGWYGTKEELKETEDFYPFILVKLNVPSTI